MRNFINILHLSDLHFGYDFKKNKQPGFSKQSEKVINKFYDFISKDSFKTKIDFIVIAGDLVHDGKNSKNFKEAEIFINKLKQGRENTEIIFVKGNHDINRNRNKKIKTFNSQDTGINRLRKKTTVQKFIEKDFYYNEQKKVYFITINDISYNDDYEIMKEDITLKKEKMLIIENDINSKKDQIDIVISIMHYPYYFYRYQDIISTKENLNSFDILKRLSDLMLVGHLHGNIDSPDLLSFSTLCFYGGTMFPFNKEDPDSVNNVSFSLLKVNAELKTVEKINYKYNEKNEKWYEETSNRMRYSYDKEKYKCDVENIYIKKINKNIEIPLMTERSIIRKINAKDVRIEIIKRYFNYPIIKECVDYYKIELDNNSVFIKLFENNLKGIDKKRINFPDKSKVHVLIYGDNQDTELYKDLQKKYKLEIYNQKLILHKPIKIVYK